MRTHESMDPIWIWVAWIVIVGTLLYLTVHAP